VRLSSRKETGSPHLRSLRNRLLHRKSTLVPLLRKFVAAEERRKKKTNHVPGVGVALDRARFENCAGRG